jgi:uncharacterized protein (TIRG00374 family)
VNPRLDEPPKAAENTQGTQFQTADQARGQKTADWKRLLPGLVISAAALIAVFWLADLERLAEAVRLADYRLVILGMFMALIWLLGRGKVWQTLLQEKASFSQVFFTITEGYLLNNLLPFRLGEVGRSFLLSEKAGLDFWQVFSTILIERSMDLALAAGILLSTLPFVIGADWALEAALVTVGIVLAFLVVLYLLARYREWACQQFDRLVKRWTWLDRLGGQRLPAFLNGLAVLTDISRFLRAIFWILLNWGFAILQYYVFVRAFFPQAQFLWAAFSLGVVALGAAAPSSPGAVGVLEISLVGALSVFGLDASTALALALTVRLSNYLFTGILGAYALARDGETLTGVYQRVRKIH